MTEEKAIIQRPHAKTRTWHHPNEEKEPKCNTPVGRGNWVVVPIDEIPQRFEQCKKCSGEFNPVNSLDEGEDSILKKARNSSPEDFGMEPFP